MPTHALSLSLLLSLARARTRTLSLSHLGFATVAAHSDYLLTRPCLRRGPCHMVLAWCGVVRCGAVVWCLCVRARACAIKWCDGLGRGCVCACAPAAPSGDTRGENKTHRTMSHGAGVVWCGTWCACARACCAFILRPHATHVVVTKLDSEDTTWW